ncbi:allantoin permease [Exophiala viscosa]|uniref:allantoin permease n=1 Tax=Exophiala viscosa TaxID=2486360 RepID=UPI0021980F79|nr:allantoin permease [Exophiala viscosa]
MAGGFKPLAKRLEVPYEGGTIPSRWINNDIKPIEKGRRTWTFWTFHNLWVLTNTNISTYMTGSSLIALGLTWWQAIIAIIVGAILSTVFIVLNSMPGAYYHLGFPIANRYVWGMYGSSFVIYNRILLSLVWYAVQSWIGGQCVYVCLEAIWPNLEQRIPNHIHATGLTSATFLCYAIFCIISLPLIWIRPHKLKVFLYVGVASILIFEVVLLIWALATMDGFGSTISSKPATQDSSVGWTILYGIISAIGGIAAGILNQSDYARFARRPRDAIYGQLASAATYSIISSVIGILVTAATQQRYGGALWSLPDLLVAMMHAGGSRSRAAGFFAGAALVVSQWGINIPGNALSGGFDLAATFPTYINIRRGAYLTALLSNVVNPWQLLASASTFLAVLSSYGVFLGPMIGLMISSYYIVNRRKIKVDDLYRGDETSIYWFTWGIDWRAPIAWALGVFPSMPGFVSNVNTSISVSIGWTRVYYISFLVGFSISAVVYVGLHHFFPAPNVKDFVLSPTMAKQTMADAQTGWDNESVQSQSVLPKDVQDLEELPKEI